MAEYIFGANILENLTTGMYQDSKVIYREYIQNACDQVDKAEQLGILRPRNTGGKHSDLGQGIIDIWLDSKKRNIVIEDNATGIKSSEFQRILGNIADSDKIMGQDKGFRGIGRLCGLAYCQKLIFTSRYQGENIVSVMECNAQKMREMINESNINRKKHSAIDVLNSMVEFSTRPVHTDDAEHFFRVELISVNNENEELFGGKDDNNIERLTNYLSFVAPVPYHADFFYRTDIYDYTHQLGVKIDEYNIRLNGEQILKKYKTRLKTSKGIDEIYGVEFHNFYLNDELLAWMWFGKSAFLAAIKGEEISRGIRLRKENIQIGDEDTLRDMFTREIGKRGNSYFIGEIFAVSRELIPNSQRTYFNENPIRINFEHSVINYFDNTLYQIYREGSSINSTIKKINDYVLKKAEFEKKVTEGRFLSNQERETEEKELKSKKEEAEKAEQVIEKKKLGGSSILSQHIIDKRSKDIAEVSLTKNDSTVNSSQKTKPNRKNIEDEFTTPIKTQKKFLSDILFPSHNKNERKLLSEMLEKIFVIIQNSTDRKNSDHIIKKIKDELK